MSNDFLKPVFEATAQAIKKANINANKAYDLPYDLLIKTLKKRQ
jgi:hypothetical protein